MVKWFNYFVLVSVAGLSLASAVYVLSCCKILLQFYFSQNEVISRCSAYYYYCVIYTNT